MSTKTNSSRLQRLSARECQVLKLVAEGHTSREIARIAGVKPSSVYTYRSRIMNKLLAQLELLREMKCDYSQGYLHHRPMTAAELEQVLAG